MDAQRLYNGMEREKMDYLLLSSQENVSYLSGMGLPLAFGATFEYGGGYPLAYAVVSRAEQKITLVVSSFYENLAKEHSTADSIVSFKHYDHFQPIDQNEALVCALRCSLPRARAEKVKVGIEFRTLPALLLRMLEKEGFGIGDCTSVLSDARRIKTPLEIEQIRRSVYIEDCGQNRLLEYAEDFHEENALDLWAGIVTTMNKAAGERLDVSGELVTGPGVQSPDYPGGPKNMPVFPGEMGRMDISIRYNGYWCDCCNTVVFGRSPSDEQKDCFKIVREAYEAAKNELKPGNRMSDVNEAACRVYQKYNRAPVVYTGHQLGCAVNESPRITCYEHDVLEPNMVVCIEPQQYGKEGSGVGVRLEKVIWIREGGAQELNQFLWGIN